MVRFCCDSLELALVKTRGGNLPIVCLELLGTASELALMFLDIGNFDASTSFGLSIGSMHEGDVCHVPICIPTFNAVFCRQAAYLILNLRIWSEKLPQPILQSCGALMPWEMLVRGALILLCFQELTWQSLVAAIFLTLITFDGLVLCGYDNKSHGSTKNFYTRITVTVWGVLLCLGFDLLFPWCSPPPSLALLMFLFICSTVCPIFKPQ